MKKYLNPRTDPIYVTWETGSTLSLVPEIDEFKIL